MSAAVVVPIIVPTAQAEDSLALASRAPFVPQGERVSFGDYASGASRQPSSIRQSESNGSSDGSWSERSVRIPRCVAARQVTPTLTIRQQLELARSQGALLQRNVQQPFFICGIGLMLAGLAFIVAAHQYWDHKFVLPSSVIFMEIGVSLATIGAITGISGILPWERTLPLALFVVSTTVSLALSCLAVANLVAFRPLNVPDGCKAAATLESCERLRFVAVARYIASIINAVNSFSSASILFALLALRLRGRPLQGRAVIRTVRYSVLMYQGTSALFSICTIWATDSTFEVPSLARAIVLILFIFLVASPAGIRRIHAWLRARASSGRRAVLLAALIGDRTTQEMLELTAATFRAVSLGLVHLEDVLDAEPNPALYSVSRPANFGECDAFVSLRPLAALAPRPLPCVFTATNSPHCPVQPTDTVRTHHCVLFPAGEPQLGRRPAGQVGAAAGLAHRLQGAARP